MRLLTIAPIKQLISFIINTYDSFRINSNNCFTFSIYTDNNFSGSEQTSDSSLTIAFQGPNKHLTVP